MARRFSAPYQSEPVSSLATWARNLAVFSVVAVVVSILIVRFGFLEMKPALATFFGALACAGLSILVGLAAFAAIWQNGSRGMGRILLAFLINAVLLAYPAYLALQYRKLPPIHDITTDPIDPPRFEALARLRSGDGANTAVYAGLYSAEQQRLAYPDIETVELEVPPQRAYEVTLALVTKRKWLVIDERPPQPPRRIGRIEAVARTPIMGFREDVSIRVTPDGEDSRVDIRSSSRYFESDLGSNAARVSKLIDDINTAVDNAKPAGRRSRSAGQGAGEDGEEVTHGRMANSESMQARNLDSAIRYSPFECRLTPSDTSRRSPDRHRSPRSRARPDLPDAPARNSRRQSSAAGRCRYRSRAPWSEYRPRPWRGDAGSRLRAPGGAGSGNGRSAVLPEFPARGRRNTDPRRGCSSRSSEAM